MSIVIALGVTTPETSYSDMAAGSEWVQAAALIPHIHMLSLYTIINTLVRVGLGGIWEDVLLNNYGDFLTVSINVMICLWNEWTILNRLWPYTEDYVHLKFGLGLNSLPFSLTNETSYMIFQYLYIGSLGRYSNLNSVLECLGYISWEYLSDIPEIEYCM